METIRATDDLVIELHSKEDDAEPMLKVKNLSGELGGESGTILIYLPDVPALCEALSEAAALLAAETDEYGETTSNWLDD